MHVRRNRFVPVLVAGLLAAAAIGPGTLLNGPPGALAAVNHAPDAPTGLSVGDRTRPLDVEGTPTLGWFPQDQDGNEIQTAYEIQLTRDSDGALIWDSGKALSSAESYVSYAGPLLADGTSYSWRVKTWDRGDLDSPWSAWARFDTGITDAEWGGADWIRRVTTGNDSTVDYTLARKQFTVDGASPVVRARAYTSAMGEYELHVNGQAIYRGDSFDYPGEGQYAVTDITPYVQAGLPLVFGMLYYYHTCTCQGRANGPPSVITSLFADAAAGATNVKLASVSTFLVGDTINIDSGASRESRTVTAVGTQGRNTTLRAASVVGATNVKVNSVTGLSVGDTLNIDTGANLESVTITVVGTSGPTGSGVTFTPALALAHANGAAVSDPGTGIDFAPALTLAHAAGASADNSNVGPSAMLVRIVVDHADGSRETFVSDGTWKVTKDTAYTNSTITYRNSDSGDRVERYDATQEVTGWDTVGYDDSAWDPATVMGPHPQPVNPLRDTFSHLDGNVSGIAYETVNPVSVTRFADGSLIADFGKVIPAVPQLHFHAGVAGTALTIQTTYRLNNTTSSAALATGATNVKVGSVSNFFVGDTITIDAPADGHGAGNPEVGTITAVGTSGSGGTGITFSPALTMDHPSGVWVQGSRAGTSTSDTQGSNMAWYYTEKDGDQVAQAFTHWAWRYLQINAPGPGETLSDDDIAAVIQHTDAPADRSATFTSNDPMLDTVFGMLQRSGLYVSQETGEDTPTREKGQFLGDSVDVAFANTTASGERNATKRMIREFVYSQSHSWKNTQSGYCAVAPCSYDGYGVLSAGRLNAVYPNGDNMRDIPDYTEWFPDMVWQYYMESGDLPTLQSAYQAMKNVADYIKANEPASGAASDLVWLLAGGSGSYANGIIDWPSRLGYVFNGNGARTIHSEEGVGAFRDVAAAAAVLGNAADVATYGGYADDLTAQINAVQQISGDTLYSDGIGLNSTNLSAAATAGNTNIKVNSVAPFTVGDSVALDTGNGALKEVRTVVAVGTSGSAGTGVDLNAPLNVNHNSNVAVVTSSATQLFPASTALALDAAAGDAVLKVNSTSGFSTSFSTSNAGQAIVVGTGADREIATITAVGSSGAAGTGLTLSAPLAMAHPSGTFVATPSQQAQTFAIYEGVAPQSSWPSITDYIAAQHLKTGVMDWGITAQAMVMADRPDILLDFLTNVDQFGPARVVAQGGTFAWEDWVIGTGNTSMSHGWGSRGVAAILDGLAGISVTSPGASTVTIAPPRVGLTHVNSTRWTQRGTVTSDWSRGPHGMVLDVVIPDNQAATISLPAVAGQVYTASGAGDPQYVGLVDGRETFMVGSGASHYEAVSATTTSVAADFNPTQYGHPVTFTATVATVDPDAPTPTGMLQFSIDGSPVGGPVALDAAGQATLGPISDLALGTHTIGAEYAGEDSFLPSSGSVDQTVKRRLATTTAVTSDLNPSIRMDPVTFTATVIPENAGSGITPAGFVQFKVDGVAVGAPVALGAAAQATLTTTDIPLGNHGVRALYLGSPDYTGSTSPAYVQGVHKPAPTGSVTSAPASPLTYGTRPITFTATLVNPIAPVGSLTPASVRFLIDGTSLGADAALQPDGTATFTVTWNLPLGSHIVKARYLGNAEFAPGFTAPYTLVITP